VFNGVQVGGFAPETPILCGFPPARQHWRAWCAAMFTHWGVRLVDKMRWRSTAAGVASCVWCVCASRRGGGPWPPRAFRDS